MRNLMTYVADKGSVVINGICFSNGVGDGAFEVVFFNKRPSDVKEIAWLDLRHMSFIEIWQFDCDPSRTETFQSVDFDNAQAIGFGIDGGGNLIIWKLF